MSSPTGEFPSETGVVKNWAERVVEPIIDRNPRVRDAGQTANTARAAGEALDKRQRGEGRPLRSKIFGAERVRKQPLHYEFIHPFAEVDRADRAATQAREEIAQLRGMPVQQAAKRIERQHQAAERARLAREARARKLRSPSHDHDLGTSSRPHHDGPSLGLKRQWWNDGGLIVPAYAFLDLLFVAVAASRSRVTYVRGLHGSPRSQPSRA